MKRIAATAALVLMALVATTGCEPKMTITASLDAGSRPGCGQVASVFGSVNPPAATKRVVLQRTQGGKWVDWKWISGTTGEAPHVLSAVPEPDGKYRIGLAVPSTTSAIHLRVRSDGGVGVSAGFYVTPTEYDPGQCS